MQIKSGKGKKNDHGTDRIIYIKSEGKTLLKNEEGYWEKIEDEDIFRILQLRFANEDVIYPRPEFRGSGMFFDKIVEKYVDYRKKKNDSLGRWS